MVENLLSITRLNDGRLKFKFTDQLLDEVIAESLRHISRKHDEYTIVTKCEELILVRMDVQLIIQVLVNLIDNAIKYTPKGSTITISAKIKSDKIEVSIADNGQGISNEAKDKLFEMFYTANSTVADSRRGIGIGLSLCKSIIMAHGGEIKVRDNKPQGTVFIFTLPKEEINFNE